MGSDIKWEKIGKQIAKKAKGIFTNSEFTVKYLPETALRVDEKKIFCTHLPFLNKIKNNNQENDSSNFAIKLPDTYIFYPTRNRPSKRLNDFLAVLDLINFRLEALGVEQRIYGVLTTELSEDEITKYPLGAAYLRVITEVSDQQLELLYKNAHCLLFTSEMEGNFPTQISEALKFRTPIISSKMALIVAELGQYSDYLQLIETGNIAKYAEAVISLLSNRDDVLKSQELVSNWVDAEFTIEKFNEEFLEMLR